MISSFARDAAIVVAYGVAFAWLLRTSAALRFLPKLPNLLLQEWESEPQGSPKVCVVVPARNEEELIRATLETLLRQDYSALEIVAADLLLDPRG